MNKENESEKKKAKQHLESVKKEAHQKIKEAEEKAANEKRKAEDVIKQATKMIIEARSKKSEIKEKGQVKMALIQNDGKGSPYPDHDANWDFTHHPWPQEHDSLNWDASGSDPQWWGSPNYFAHYN